MFFIPTKNKISYSQLCPHSSDYFRIWPAVIDDMIELSLLLVKRFRSCSTFWFLDFDLKPIDELAVSALGFCAGQRESVQVWYVIFNQCESLLLALYKRDKLKFENDNSKDRWYSVTSSEDHETRPITLILTLTSLGHRPAHQPEYSMDYLNSGSSRANLSSCWKNKYYLLLDQAITSPAIAYLVKIESFYFSNCTGISLR